MPVGTKIRSLRVPDELWIPAQEKSRANGEDVSKVLVRALQAYLDEPDPRGVKSSR